MGFVTSWLAFGLGFLISFILTPLIVKGLGEFGFGIWALIQSFSGYYGLVNLGVASALQRFVGRDLAKEDVNSLQATVGSTLLFFSASSLIILLVVALSSRHLAKFFSIPSTEISQFQIAISLCALAVVLDFLSSTASAIITAHERMDLINGFNSARALFQAATVVAVVYLLPTLSALAASAVAVSAIGLGVQVAMVKRLSPDLSFSWRGAEKERLKSLLGFGSSTALLRIAGMVHLRMGNVIIGRFAGASSVGYYSVATSLIQSMYALQNASLRALTPRFTRLEAEEDSSEIRRLLRTSLFVSSFMASVFSLAVFIFSPSFIELWLGPNFSSSSVILQILSLAYLLDLAQMPLWNLLLAIGKHHFMARVAAVESLFILASGLVAAHFFGAIGFATASAVCMIATRVFITPLYGQRVTGLKVKEYCYPAVAPFASAIILILISHMFSIGKTCLNLGLIPFLITVVVFCLVHSLIVLSVTWRADFLPSSIIGILKRARLYRAT